MALDQRETVERSLSYEHGGVPGRWPRHTYVIGGDRARAVPVDAIISTQFGAYWHVLTKDESEDAVTFLIEALRPTDPRTHNGVVTMLFGGTLT